MTTKPQSKLAFTGKLKGGVDTCGRGKKSKPMAKMVLYLPADKMLELRNGIDSFDRGHWGHWREAQPGNVNGIVIAEIVKQWKEKR